ncbi:MAG: 6-bladed beta-propeller [Gemmatimonadetes bacterium]|nr:6-bladed beta-propeller [Gemmatimonadota bacterium]
MMDATMDRAGRLLVADDLNHRVAVFGRDGRFVGSIGRKGRGPGEFESPWLVVTDARDSIFVWDMALSRVSVFAPNLAFRRSFATPPQWKVNSIRFLPDGRLLVAAYGGNEPGVLHVLSRTGQRQRSFGPRPDATGLSGFDASLLGGTADITGSTIVYSSKSPYELWFFDLEGRLLQRCAGQRSWTTQPSAVVRTNAAESRLEWNRFVHSYSVVALGGGLFLNMVLDPANERTTLDLVTQDCRLLRRTSPAAPIFITDAAGPHLIAVRNLEYPEVLIYERRVTR